MKKNNKETMLDLSFLTEEEYEKLMKVLQRDEELKKKDSERIRRLQGSLKDEKKKKFVTGEWFDDVKAKRFEEDLHGSDLLRASIRKKKSRTQNGTCRDGNESEDSGPGSSPPDAPPCILTESSPDLSNDRFSGNKEVDYTEGPGVLPKPKVRPPVLQSMPTSCLPDKKYSLTEVSPADSGIGLSPFGLTDNSQPPEKGHYTLPSSPTKLPEKEVVQPSPATQWDISVDTATKKGFQEESSTPSKIPVKRKPTKGLSKSEMILDNLAECDPNLKKTESLPSSGLSSPDAENKILKQGSHFTVFALKDKPKEQETIVDRDHFRTLKSFWERAADSPTVNNMSDLEPLEKQNSSESNGRQFFPLNRSISVQSDKSQNGEQKSSADLPHRTRHPFKRTVTPSSSEDEPLYIHVPHSRKGASSSAPRSTYGRSKAASVASKGITFAERNGRHNGTEENRSPNRHSKKSKLPVRAASVQLDTRVDAPIAPMKERLQSVSEPETPSPTPDDELIVPEHVQKRAESLQSKVRILIGTATTDEEREKASDLAACDYMEQQTLATNGELTEQCEAADNTADTDDDSPVAMALARANSLSNARSMVNIYTTTETYNKPQTTQQLLDPERAKELSKSTPALLSETESDTASEISFQFNRHRKTQSSGSHSSDMASVSSISNSVISVYSGDFGSVDAQGMAQFALDYDEKNREFQIFIAQCNDLAVVDEKKGRSDPYVKTYLLPDKARMGKRKTSVKKRTLNPVYNEILRYKIEKMVLLIQKLNLSVWHNDPLGRNSFLGEIEIDLASWDWSNKKLNWYTLKPRSLSAINGVDHRGVMNLSIRYIPPGSLGPKNPSSGEVHIWVKDTKDLPQLRPSGVDSFVKCYVLPDTSKKSYQKTRVIKKDPNPVFNHTIVYDGFHTEDLKDACVELTVWDHEKLTNHFLGGIRLGLGTGKSYGIPVDWMDSTQEEIAFWQEMMSAPSEWHEGSLPLRSLAGKRKFK